jgi:RNA polymerase sigma factor (sigma-70 family)
MLGLGVFTAASLGAGLSTSAGFLIAMRLLQGFGAAVVLPAALSIVMNMFAEGAERNWIPARARIRRKVSMHRSAPRPVGHLELDTIDQARASAGGERELLAAARRGDEDAYGRLVGPYRAELDAHCYRMLGSAADAEDALQEALLRAWRALPQFEGRSSLRSWLYKIATNACLRAIERRPKRVLPIDYAPESDAHGSLAEPVTETVWLEPYPDDRLALASRLAGPDARYEQLERVELAFIAALQHLPARQRAALIIRDVLGSRPAKPPRPSTRRPSLSTAPCSARTRR